MTVKINKIKARLELNLPSEKMEDLIKLSTGTTFVSRNRILFIWYSLGKLSKGTLSMLDMESFVKALPSQMRGGISTTVVDKINAMHEDPDIAAAMRDNVVGYTSVLRNGNYKMADFLNAVKYCTFQSMGDTYMQAWAKTFPDRYSRLKVQAKSDKDISSHVAMYRKTQLVTILTDQMLIPMHLLYADVFHTSVKVAIEIMTNTDVSPKVRSDTALGLMIQLKRPEVQRIELDIGTKEGGAIQELKDITAKLASQQHSMIAAGVNNAKEIAHQRLVIEGEYSEQ